MIKIRLLFAVAFLSAAVSGFSFPWKDIKFSGNLSTDYYLGQVREIVYPDSGWKNDYLSELLWEIDNIVMIKGSGTAALGKWALNLSASTALNKGTGGMDDYDWGDYTSTRWTNWSESRIFLDRSAVIDTSLEYTKPVSGNFSIPFGIGYRLNYLNWSDKAGKYIYYWNFNTDGYYSNVQAGDFGNIPGINYTFVQNIFLIKAGAEYSRDNFTGTIKLSYSPLIYAWDLDNHIMRDLYFLDTFTSHLWYRIDISAACTVGISSQIIFSVNFEELPEVMGNAKMYGSSTGYFPDGAGLASRIGTFSIGYTRWF